MSTISYATELIFESETDKQRLLETMKSERDVFNFASQFKFENSRNSIVELHAKTYRAFRNLHPEVPSQIVIRGEHSCLSAYKTAKSNKHILKKPIYKTALSVRLDERIYTYKDDILRLTVNIGQRINTKLYIYPKLQVLLLTYKFGDPEIYEKNGKILISIPFKIPETVITKELSIGVDLGILRFATTSEGNIFVDKPFNAKKRKTRYLKRCLQSKNTKSAKRHLKKLRHRERNQTRDLTHKLANKILNSTIANTFVLEDLSKIKDKKKRGIPKYRKINKLSQIPFYELRRILTYKALLHGKQVITVCPSYTSQLDHKTQLLDGKRQGIRYYAKGGEVYDADINASVNIAIRSKLPFSYSNTLDGQAIVNSPIV